MDLLCRYRPEDVIRHTKKWYYPTDVCIKACREHDLKLAVAHLLRRTGAYAESLDAYIAILTEAAEKLLEEGPGSGAEAGYRKHFAAAVRVCGKSAKVAKEGGDNNPLWLKMLCHVRYVWIKLAQQQVRSLALGQVITDCLRQLLTTTLDYVRYEQVFNFITETYGDSLDLGTFRDMFSAILASHLLHEKTLDSAKQLLFRHANAQFSQLVQTRHRGRTVKEGTCAKCGRRAGLFGGEFLAFPCGHTCHVQCAGKRDRCEVCVGFAKGRSDAKVVAELERSSESNLGADDEPEGEEEEKIMRQRRVSETSIARARSRKMELYLGKMRVFERMQGKSFAVRKEIGQIVVLRGRHRGAEEVVSGSGR